MEKYKGYKARVGYGRNEHESKCKHCDKKTVYYMEASGYGARNGEDGDITPEQRARGNEATGYYCEDHITPDMYEAIECYDNGDDLLHALGYKRPTLAEKISSIKENNA